MLYLSSILTLSWIREILGLANKKTVTIQPAGKDQSVLLATTKSKKQNKPSSLLHKSVMKKEFPRMAKAVKNQVMRKSNFETCLFIVLLGLLSVIAVIVFHKLGKKQII